ncbi:MAG: type II CAAX endopeptidase family protein [Prevotellaceae bacterium]|nr:type II CAAX endopeptidase family protein [Prevotellaceae bacterium]
MKSDKIIAVKLWGPIVVAAVLWFVMFSPWTAPRVNFWYTMTVSAVVLTTLATLSCRACVTTLRFTPGQMVAGVAIAAVLWAVFWVGDKVSQLMFSFARPEVDMIYGMKTGTDPVVVGLLLLLIIGPAEELFWRGFVQCSLSARWGADAAFAVTLVLYTVIHVWAFNVMLLLAALVVGGCWGLLYRLRPQALPALIVSHAVWDVCAFVLFPF